MLRDDSDETESETQPDVATPDGDSVSALTGPVEDEDVYPLNDAYETAGIDHITPELRREVLGKLVEFEVRLAGLTLKQQNFALGVLHDPSNITRAAEAAGYAAASASVTASQLIINPKVAHVISLGQQLREDRTMVSSDRTLNELAIIAFSDISHYMMEPGTGELKVKPGIPQHAMRAVSQAEFTTTVVEKGEQTTTTFKTKIKLWSKTDTLRMLALYQKLFNPDGGSTKIVDKSKHIHNTWQFGDKSVSF